MKKMTRSQKIGKLSEKEFSKWCTEADIIVNGSEDEDLRGWDFYLEFPILEQDNSIPSDIQKPAIECKVQVKSTDTTKNSYRLSLENLHHLINFRFPAFICVMRFEGKNFPQQVHLVHIDKGLITKILKRIRELYVSGKNDLNKQYLHIPLKKSNLLSNFTGKTLYEAIIKHIPNGLDSYINEKQKIIQTVGFENGNFIGSFDVSCLDGIDKMIDLSLGLITKINVSNLEIRNQRFGIIDAQPKLSSEKCKITIPDLQPTDLIKLRIRLEKFGKEIKNMDSV